MIQFIRKRTFVSAFILFALAQIIRGVIIFTKADLFNTFAYWPLFGGFAGGIIGILFFFVIEYFLYFGILKLFVYFECIRYKDTEQSR